MPPEACCFSEEIFENLSIFSQDMEKKYVVVFWTHSVFATLFFAFPCTLLCE